MGVLFFLKNFKNFLKISILNFTTKKIQSKDIFNFTTFNKIDNLFTVTRNTNNNKFNKILGILKFFIRKSKFNF